MWQQKNLQVKILKVLESMLQKINQKIYLKYSSQLGNE